MVYRNLFGRDTLFGLDLMDLVIMAAAVNIVFRCHQPESWNGKAVNLLAIGLIYLTLVYVKRQFPKKYLNNLVMFLFKRRRFLPDREEKHSSWAQGVHEKKRIRQSDA